LRKRCAITGFSAFGATQMQSLKIGPPVGWNQ
jgi:hypothetical protein